MLKAKKTENPSRFLTYGNAPAGREVSGTAQWVGPVPGGGEHQATSQLLIPMQRELCVHSPVCLGTGNRKAAVPAARHQSDSFCRCLEVLHPPAPTHRLPAPPVE